MTQKTGRFGASGREFCLYSLEKEDIEETLQLMDRCVGENLYQKEELEQAYRTENPTGMPAGYFGTCWQDSVSRNKRSISQTGTGSLAYEVCVEAVCGEGHRGSVYHLLECRR